MKDKILVVDDEQGITTLLKDYFEMNEYDVYTAKSGTEALHIFISTDNNYFVFQIDDDGKGFDNEMLRFATEPFFKDRDATSVHLGMGLHISKILCERHNGFLVLSNNKNAGARVTAKFNMKL